jgi:hypothetical protein
MSITIQKSTTKNGVCCALRKTATLKENFGRIIGLKVRNGTMKTKWIIMQELEDSNCASPYLIVDTEERAEALCYQLESENPGFIFWTCVCNEE